MPDTNGLHVINTTGHSIEQAAIFYPIKEALLSAAGIGKISKA